MFYVVCSRRSQGSSQVGLPGEQLTAETVGPWDPGTHNR